MIPARHPIPASIAACRAEGSSALRISEMYFSRHLLLPTLRGHSVGYASQNSAKRRSKLACSHARAHAFIVFCFSFRVFSFKGGVGGFFLFPLFCRCLSYQQCISKSVDRLREGAYCFFHFASLLRLLALHDANICAWRKSQ